MRKGTFGRKTVSLSNELHLVMDSIRGVRSLTRQWIDSFGMDQEVPEQISSLLVILIERLRLMDCVVRGTVDPHLAWSPQNDGKMCPGDPNEEDVVLRTWSERRLARHHRAEWRRLNRRLGMIKAEKKESES
jgi:hypothetical protein